MVIKIIFLLSSDTKKLCKKLKVSSDKAYYLKHYKDGEFHKDYDRNESVNSLRNFLRDPTGDLPWDEDPSATDIYHLQDGEVGIFSLMYIHNLKRLHTTQVNYLCGCCACQWH